MTDSYGDSQQNGGQGEGGRDGGRDGGRRRGAGNREGGGFRIRLSDNEMRSVRALQEAFNLRSTVAVLGFAVRSLAQMLEDGQLDALIEQERSRAPRGGGRRSEGGRGGSRGDGGHRGESGRGGAGGRGGDRPDPFARPAKPQQAPVEENVDAPEPEGAAPASEATESEATIETSVGSTAEITVDSDAPTEDAQANQE
ncbi:hypothetical protein [Synechococcus sp. UW140]|uniref:hypothetical protein n=1 Tax=Synechococcus sp. UW140 TaxID=368503 RepID=UPI000E0E4F51|nr:hypothetical protein [Synechococcus sp. UW140]